MRDLYLTNRFFTMLTVIVLAFIVSYFWTPLLIIGKVGIGSLLFLLLIDIWLLFRKRRAFFATREMTEKLSNGDQNPIEIFMESYMSIPLSVSVIDEIPFQFQRRDLQFDFKLKAFDNKRLNYNLRPVKRGEYSFGAIRIFVRSKLSLAKRRFSFEEGKSLPVYPSFIQMRKYELLAISNNLSDFGIKKVRRIGQNKEFDQITDYVRGDDYRSINWKATARKGGLMVNKYQDERAQSVYCLIDKGRVMRMPFASMSLLDYAINASLVISNIAIKKQDKAGIICFHHKVSTIIPASRRNVQMRLIQEALYKQKTNFKESNYDMLYSTIRSKVSQRSLMLLFSNFDTIEGLKRQLPFLRRLAKQHVVVSIFFENTELVQLSQQESNSTREVYQQVIAQKFILEKRLIQKELSKYGIYSVLTAPEHLTVNTINKYLELKARGVL